jgi:hypothetical protein
VVGAMKLSVFEKNGEHRASLDVVARQVTPLRRPGGVPGAERMAEGGQGGRAASLSPSASGAASDARETAFDDGLPGW